MAQSNYQWAQKTLNEQRNIDSPERSIAAAQVAALLAVVDEMSALREQVQRLATSVEGLQADLPQQIQNSAEALRHQIKSAAHM